MSRITYAAIINKNEIQAWLSNVRIPVLKDNNITLKEKFFKKWINQEPSKETSKNQTNTIYGVCSSVILILFIETNPKSWKIEWIMSVMAEKV